MVYCPVCGSELEQLSSQIFRCSKCGRWWVVLFDSEWGDLLTVTLVNPRSIKTALAVSEMLKREK